MFIVHVANSHGKDETASVEPSLRKLKVADASASIKIPATPEADERSLVLTPNALLAPMKRQQLFQEYLCSYLPARRYGRGYEIPWFAQFPGLLKSTAALQVSLTALCISSLGRENNDDGLVSEGVHHYAQGLGEVQKLLNHPNKMHSDETLAACVALMLMEVVECPAHSRSGYLSHQRGIAHLIELRGPGAHTSPLGHSVLRTFRLIEAMDALERHASSFLADPSWLEVPWQHTPKSPYERVLDLLLEIPGLLADADEMLQAPEHSHPKLASGIFWKYWRLDARLQDLQRELESDAAGPLYWPVLSSLESSADDHILGKVFPAVFEFPDLRTANTMMLLWTTMAMARAGCTGLHGYMQELSIKGQSQAVSMFRQLPSLESCESWISLARNACQCVEYCVKEPASGFARLTASVPLQVLTGYLQGDSRGRRELVWTYGMLERISKRGMRLLQYTMDFQRYEMIG